jgi:hypothetical protein
MLDRATDKLVAILAVPNLSVNDRRQRTRVVVESWQTFLYMSILVGTMLHKVHPMLLRPVAPLLQGTRMHPEREYTIVIGSFFSSGIHTKI